MDILPQTILDPPPDPFAMYDEPDRSPSETLIADEEYGEDMPFDRPLTPPVEEGTGRIIVDRFGFYLPPPKPPKPVFPKPLQPEDIEALEKWAGTIELSEPEVDMYEVPKEDPRRIVRRYTLSNSRGVSVQVINYGATVTSIKVPDKNGRFGDVLLGFDTMEAYQSEKNQYLGATLGRYSSILSEGKFTVGNQEFLLTQNAGQNHTIGGYFGFDKMVWDSCVYKNKVVMTYVSEDFEEGYPGQLMVQIHFSLSRNNIFTIHTTAVTSRPTVASLGNHLLFNLAGHGAGPEGLTQHSILVNADRFIVTDNTTGIPTGEIHHVGATYYDLRVPRPLGKAIKKAPGGGYDHTFCLTKGVKRQSVAFAAR